MSELLIRETSSGTGNAIATQALSGTGGPIAGGKPNAAAGKVLPAADVARPQPTLEKIVEKLNVSMNSVGRVLHFQVDLDNGRAVIQVLDRETGELIRQIPPEKISTYITKSGGLEIRLYDERV